MKRETYKDGSFTEFYEEGDLVELTERHPSSWSAKPGDWGEVVLKDKEDRDRGYSTSISFIRIRTAGVSTPKDSFVQCIPSVPVWHVQSMMEEQ